MFNKIIKLNKKNYLKNFQIILENLNKKKKIILIFNALSGSHHSIGLYYKNFKNKGWWNLIYNIFYKIIKDINIISISNLGTCFGSSNKNNININENKNYNLNFIKLNIYNWIKLYKITLKKIKIKKLFIIIGGSFGGMQVLIWNIIYPNTIKKSIIIATPYKVSLKNISYNKISKLSINNNYNLIKNKFYNYKNKNIKGLKLTRIIGHITYLSKYDLKKKTKIFFYKNNLKKIKKIKISKYLDYQSNKFSKKFDINSYLLIISIINNFNIKKINKKKINLKKKNFLIINFKNDWRFNIFFSFKLIKFLLKYNNKINTKNLNLKSGHDSFLIYNNKYINILTSYINNRSDRN